MIPRHDFLTACIPLFFRRRRNRLSPDSPRPFTTPDLFQFNLYSEGRIPNEQDYFYRDVQIMRNESNTGNLRRDQHHSVKKKRWRKPAGFFTGVITEDFATGMAIQSKGYQCYAISESHACGMAPEDLKSLIKQRQRWARGCIQTGRKINLLFLKGLNFKQKMSYLTSITYWFGALKRFVYLMSPILFAVFNVIVVKCTVFSGGCVLAPHVHPE